MLHYDDALETYIQLRSDDAIFVQHNYNKTRDLLGKEITDTNKFWVQTQKKSEVASEHNMPVPRLNFGQRKLPPGVLNDRISTNEQYYPINYLPFKSEKPSWKNDPRGSIELPQK